MIEESLYREIVRSIPIVCVDVVLATPLGYLLVRRANEPLKGEWWVIGGRIHQGETAREAAVRKVLDEVGVALSQESLSFRGFYEDTFPRNAFGDGPYQTVSLVFEVAVDGPLDVSLDEQSSDWTWADELPARLVIQPTVA